MSDLTPEALDRLTRFDADATPGPWEAHEESGALPEWAIWMPDAGCDRAMVDNEADAALIAAMRTHLPALLDEVKQGRVRRTAERIVRDDLRNERDAARAEVAALRERIEAALDRTHRHGEWQTRAEVRAALADTATDKEADA